MKPLPRSIVLAGVALVAVAIGLFALAGPDDRRVDGASLAPPATGEPQVGDGVRPDGSWSAAGTGGQVVDAGDRSEAGARRAAVRFLELTEDAVQLDPAEAAAIQRSISSERSAERLGAEVFDQLTAVAAEVPDGVVLWVTPIAAGSTARGDGWVVEVWYVEVIVIGDQLAIEQWRTATYSLVWEAESWRIDEVGVVDGPVPARPATLVASSPAELIAATVGLDDAGLVP